MNRLPEDLVIKLADLLRDHHATALYAATIGLLGDQIQPTPRDTGEPAMVNADTVAKLIAAYSKQGHLVALAPALALIEPYLPVLERSEPIIVEINPDKVALEVSRSVASDLSGREIQALVGMANGMSNGDIGKSLYLSEDTIKTHARRLFRKLGARDRAHAVRLAYDAGILQAPRRSTPSAVA